MFKVSIPLNLLAFKALIKSRTTDCAVQDSIHGLQFLDQPKYDIIECPCFGPLQIFKGTRSSCLVFGGGLFDKTVSITSLQTASWDLMLHVAPGIV
jgi:hypothetical protein